MREDKSIYYDALWLLINSVPNLIRLGSVPNY